MRRPTLHLSVLKGGSKGDLFVFTTRAYASLARAVLGVVILSVRLSHAWIVTKLNDALHSAYILIPHERAITLLL